jgi:UDP-N-acetylmuramate dehydrogenase
MLSIKKNFLIKNLSTFKIGGWAKYFCEVKSFSEFRQAIEIAKKLNIPYKVFAGGSNVVFPDGRLNCLLIKIRQLTIPKLKITGNKIKVDAGVELMILIKKAIANGLRGLETLSGIPGTVGGAIVGNAGAYGHSISEVVEKILVWNPYGAVQDKPFWLNNSDCNFQYRHSIFKEKPFIVLRAVLKLKKGRPEKLKTISQNIIKTRLQKYRPGLRCPGSFFKNILAAETAPAVLKLIDQTKIIEGKIPAGYLLEQVGAKGLRVGGIRIADFHGNLLINDGKATAKDVEKIAKILKQRVRKKFHIDLEEEIRYF